MVGISDWLGLGLALYSLAVTLLTFWLALRWWGRGLAVRLWSWWIVAGNLLWSAILFAGSVIAARYFQRLESALYVAVAYAAAALAGFFLSLLRARLRLRAVTTGPRPASGLSRNEIMHNAAYLLLALVLLLLFSWPGGGPASPILLIPLFIGALLPDLDARDSLAGRLLPGVSRPVESWLGHKGAWHTPAAAAGLAIVTLPLALFPAAGPGAWYPLPLGFASHLLLDLLEPRGIMLLWPLSRSRYRFPWTPLRAHGGPLERRLVTALGVVALLLLLVVGLGPESPPPAAPAPSYEQTLERYHSLRGRYLVFGYVQGTWQSSGLRLSARFEVLNASGTSYVLLDRYTGKVFSAGHEPTDDVYLDSISLQTGSQVEVKPAEVVLQGQSLAGGLDVLYEMQREPGLQYIYVFGKVLLPEGVGSGLPVDQTLTGIPRIYREASGYYHLQYLPAANLIALGDVEVETASLLVVATYVSPPAGPTPTPLPSPPATGGAAPPPTSEAAGP